MSTEEWNILKQLLAALEPSKIAMTELQAQDITMSDFYKIWTIARLQTTNLSE